MGSIGTDSNPAGTNRRIQYASSNEWKEAQEAIEPAVSTNVNTSKILEIQQQINKWEAIQQDPNSSPYLRDKSFKELYKLQDKLKKLRGK